VPLNFNRTFCVTSEYVADVEAGDAQLAADAAELRKRKAAAVDEDKFQAQIGEDRRLAAICKNGGF
jgi:hypothetical protein